MVERVLVGHGEERSAERVVEQLVRHGYEAVAVHDGHALLDMADAWSPSEKQFHIELRAQSLTSSVQILERGAPPGSIL